MRAQLSTLTVQVDMGQLTFPFHRQAGSVGEASREGGGGQKGLTGITQNYGQHREDRAAATKNNHIFCIKLGRCLAVVGQEPGHFFPQAVGRPRETLGFSGPGALPYLVSRLYVISKEQGIQPHVQGLLTEGIDSQVTDK